MRGRHPSTCCKCPGVTVLLVFILLLQLLASGISGHFRLRLIRAESLHKNAQTRPSSGCVQHLTASLELCFIIIIKNNRVFSVCWMHLWLCFQQSAVSSRKKSYRTWSIQILNISFCTCANQWNKKLYSGVISSRSIQSFIGHWELNKWGQGFQRFAALCPKILSDRGNLDLLFFIEAK